MFVFLNEFERNTIKEIQAEGLPVNLKKIANKFKIAIHPIVNPATNSEGFITYHPYYGFEIFIQSYLPPNRYRFILAHKMSHYLLHKNTIKVLGSIDRLDREDKSGYENPREASANQLAADILMPINEINKELIKREIESISIKNLSNMVGVTEHAMRTQLNMPLPCS